MIGLALAALVGPARPAAAQRIIAGGFVDRVDLATGSVLLRTFDQPRWVQMLPQGVLRWNGREIELAQLPRNAQVTVTGYPGPAGRLQVEELRVLSVPIGAEPAALPPGTLIVGEVAGVNVNQGALYVRTRSGYRMVRIGSAPVLLNGQPVTLADVALRDTVAVQSEASAPGLFPIVTLVALFPGQTPEQVARAYRPLPMRLPAFPEQFPEVGVAVRVP